MLPNTIGGPKGPPLIVPDDAKVSIYAQLISGGNAQFGELTTSEAETVIETMVGSGLYNAIRVAVTYTLSGGQFPSTLPS